MSVVFLQRALRSEPADLWTLQRELDAAYASGEKLIGEAELYVDAYEAEQSGPDIDVIVTAGRAVTAGFRSTIGGYRETSERLGRAGRDLVDLHVHSEMLWNDASALDVGEPDPTVVADLESRFTSIRDDEDAVYYSLADLLDWTVRGTDVVLNGSAVEGVIVRLIDSGVSGTDLDGLELALALTRDYSSDQNFDLDVERFLDPELAALREAATADPSWNEHDVAAFEAQAFVDHPEEAMAYLQSLPGTHDDLNGQATGIPITDVSDEAFIAMATTALGGTSTWRERVDVISRLPETTSGMRNSLINLTYAEMATEMDLRLNPPWLVADPTDPSSASHSGANWAHYGASASLTVGGVIDGTADLPSLVPRPSIATRQQAADGNQWIFGTLGTAYADFLDEFPPGAKISESDAKSFLGKDRTGDSTFPDGTEELRDSMAYYMAAMGEPDPTERQRLTLLGSTLAGTYEQGGINSYVNDIWDLSIRDDGVVGAAEALMWLFGGDQAIATSLVNVRLGTDGEVFPLAQDLERRNEENNFVDDLDLAPLDPAAPQNQRIELDDFTIGRNGQAGDVTLDDIHGVGDRPAPAGIPDFPDSLATWEQDGGSEWLAVAGGAVFEADFVDPAKVPGSGAVNWAEPSARMWFIANWFRETHTSPELYDSLDDFDQAEMAPWLETPINPGHP